ncbi:AbrB/MazE/SpoVT family DNA-binding domain-containing protein [Brevundimonas sp. PAMC22021]|uniref:AbrB/MazE/SpoVT family DNA-binding domain-containing protein n=1 Tax=Brevundimonas sp. PAMC22021 TaxID=2861285 RepID=UPI001C629471|nr:AbrB/MazE/SpoVT family DNA-binding domain-containing protein [Brevundimonas sp. PAMC22021]QYF87477.1 AbrB/MazE/SpoVT family DNA-binding domain-containing protein [Brevundimonas sp. PAMC22021]
MRITSKGQVTIPADIRAQAGLLPHTEVDFHYDGNVVTVVRSGERTGGRGRRLTEHMAGFGDRLTMSADEVMALTRGE